MKPSCLDNSRLCPRLIGWPRPNPNRRTIKEYPMSRAQGAKTEAPGMAEAIIQHQNEMEDRLSKLIYESLGTRLSLPEGFKMSQKIESGTINKYTGSAKFADLENWLSATVYRMAVRQLGGRELDRVRVMLLMEHPDGEAKKWFIRHVTGVNRAKLDWSFEEVILALYNRFVHASTMQDAREGFRKAKYSPATGVQGFYDTLMDHAQSMAVYPDEYSILEAFLEGIPESMRTQLIRELGLSPEVNSIDDFMSQAIGYEARLKTDEYYCLKYQQNTQSSSPRTTTEQPKNKAAMPRDSKPFERPSFRPPPPLAKPRGPAVVSGKAGVCFNCGSPDHFAKECKLARRTDRVQLKAAHSAVPDDDEEGP